MSTWTYNLTVTIDKTPYNLKSDALEASGVDKIDEKIPDDKPKRFAIQPDDDPNQVEMLLIMHNDYKADVNAGNRTLTYRINDEGPDIPLRHAQLYLGEGALAPFKKAPKFITFTNKTGQSAAVTVLVVRKVVQPEAKPSQPTGNGGGTQGGGNTGGTSSPG